MKKSFVIFLMLLGVAFIYSCKDECADVNCGTHGTCAEGVCTCDDGYEKDANGQCNTERRAKFIGTYNCTVLCDGGVPVNNISSDIIATGNNINGIQIKNFAGSGSSVVMDCTVKADNSLVINDTLSILGLQTVFAGTGSFVSNTSTLTLSYTQTSNVGTTTCIYTMVKQ